MIYRHRPRSIILIIDQDRNHTTTTLNVRLGIGSADLSSKVELASRRLQRGDRITIQVRFRGPEALHPEAGEDLLRGFAEMVADTGIVESVGPLRGRTMEMVLSPVS